MRPDRQALLFSATFPDKIRRLVSDVLGDDPLTITVGRAGGANSDVTQAVEAGAYTRPLSGST